MRGSSWPFITNSFTLLNKRLSYEKHADAHDEAKYSRIAAQRRALLEAESAKMLKTATESLLSRMRKEKPSDEF